MYTHTYVFLFTYIYLYVHTKGNLFHTAILEAFFIFLIASTTTLQATFAIKIPFK